MAGRKPKYKPKLHNPLVESLAAQALTGEDIAAKLGINKTTLYRWFKQYKDFDAAYQKGREILNYSVENALYNRACGCTIKETRKRYEVDKITGEKYLQRIETIEKQLAPSVSACIHWLECRMPNEWGDNVQNAQTSNTPVIIIDDIH